jgi:hypothetical protein
VPLAEGVEDQFYVTHLGGHVRASLMYAVSRDIYAFLEGGYAAWVGLDNSSASAAVGSYFDGYYGFLISAGIVLK